MSCGDLLVAGLVILRVNSSFASAYDMGLQLMSCRVARFSMFSRLIDVCSFCCSVMVSSR